MVDIYDILIKHDDTSFIKILHRRSDSIDDFFLKFSRDVRSLGFTMILNFSFYPRRDKDSIIVFSIITTIVITTITTTVVVIVIIKNRHFFGIGIISDLFFFPSNKLIRIIVTCL